jgi:hypothetical protein
MNAEIYWKEVIWVVTDDDGKKYKVLISSSEPGQEYIKVTNEKDECVTGEKADRYVEVARRKGV